VPFTNKQTEQNFKNAKVQIENLGGVCSFEDGNISYQICSYISTARIKDDKS
jgi:hypothetical protein